MKNKKVIIDLNKVIKTMPQMIKEDFSNVNKLPTYYLTVGDENSGIDKIVLTKTPDCGVGFIKIMKPCKKPKYSFNYDEAVKQGIITKKQANKIKRAERNGAIITFLFFILFNLSF